MNCQTFSTGFNSGDRGGSGTSVMLAGTVSLGETCQPAWSSSSTACAPGATAWLTSSSWAAMASPWPQYRSRVERDPPPCPGPGRSRRRCRPRPSVGRAVLRAVCRVAPSVGCSCSSVRCGPRHATTTLSWCRLAARLGSPPARRAGFFKRLPFAFILGIVARASRELGETQGAQRPPACRLVNRDPELVTQGAQRPPACRLVNRDPELVTQGAQRPPACRLVNRDPELVTQGAQRPPACRLVNRDPELVTQGAHRPPACRLVNRDPELVEEPARQVLAAPAHHAVDGRDGTALHHPGQSQALVLIQLRPVARRRAVDQAVGTVLVEAHNPVPHDLERDTANPGRIRA